MIVVFGSINMDLMASVAAIPKAGETVLSSTYDTLFGGKGANQAVAAARAGAVVSMVGRIGKDHFGQACHENLAAHGVSTMHVIEANAPTGCAFITVDADGENAITVVSGANGTVVAGDFSGSLAAPDTIAVLQMEVPLAASLAVASQVQREGGTVIWNFAPATGELSSSELMRTLDETDIFVVNEHEVLTVAQILLHSAHDYKSAAAEIARVGEVACVVTAGASGAFAYLPDGIVHHAPALPVTPVDTTGAGDTFVGLLAAETAASKSLKSALRTACIGASLACLSKGAQAGMPLREELNATIVEDAG